jgi:hypothetical protein
MQRVKLDITLNPEELVSLENVIQHEASGLINPGPVFNRDPGRPAKVLNLVRGKFTAVNAHLNFRLGAGGGRRHLLATFSRNSEPQLPGRAAQWGQGGPTKPFTPDRPGHKGVTAYIYEGAIGNEIVELLGSSRVDVDSIFAALIAHEIGHNLGLEHEYSPAGLMFAYEDASTMERRTWPQSASAGRLGFKPWQLEKIRLQAL